LESETLFIKICSFQLHIILGINSRDSSFFRIIIIQESELMYLNLSVRQHRRSTGKFRNNLCLLQHTGQCDITTRPQQTSKNKPIKQPTYMKKCFIKNLYNTFFWILHIPAILVGSSVILSEQTVLKWHME
jgi:hypothetical protein